MTPCYARSRIGRRAEKIADAYEEIIAERELTDEARVLYNGDEENVDTPA